LRAAKAIDPVVGPTLERIYDPRRDTWLESVSSELYRSLAEMGLGREIMIFARRKET